MQIKLYPTSSVVYIEKCTLIELQIVVILKLDQIL